MKLLVALLYASYDAGLFNRTRTCVQSLDRTQPAADVAVSFVVPDARSEQDASSLCQNLKNLTCSILKVSVPPPIAACNQHLETKANAMWVGGKELLRAYPDTQLLLSDTDVYFLKSLVPEIPTGCDVGVTANPESFRWPINSGHVFVHNVAGVDALEKGAIRGIQVLSECCARRNCTGGENQGALAQTLRDSGASVCWTPRGVLNAEPQGCVEDVMRNAVSVHFNGRKKSMMAEERCTRWLPL